MVEAVSRKNLSWSPRSLEWGVMAASLVLTAACGGSEEPEPQVVEPEPKTAGSERRVEPEEQPQIEGLMGQMSQEDIRRGLQPRMPEFARCFADRSTEVEMLGGEVEFSFRVATDGSVRWVYPKRSTVGDRPTERCLLDVAASTSFRPPRGGEAEFSWPLAFDPPGDVRAAVPWSADRVEEVLTERSPDVISECRPPGSRGVFSVTAYVAPGGEILAAGAASDDRAASEALDCIAEQVEEWEDMPDPGSYPAKVTFEMR